MKINDLFEMPAAKQQRSNNQRSDLIVSRLEKFIEESNYRVFEPKDEPVFRASSAGSCPRSLIYGLKGYTDDKKASSWFILNTGTVLHELIQKYLEPIIESMEDRVESDELPLNGHYDGIVNINGKRFLLEIKTVNVENYQRLLIFEQISGLYKKQATIYMHILGLKKCIFLFVNKNNKLTNEFEKQYESDKFNPVFHEIVFEYDEKMYEELKVELQNVIEHFKNGTLPEYKRVGKCNYCDFASKCKEDRELDKAKKKLEKKLGKVNTDEVPF